VVEDVGWQASLFAAEPPAPDLTYAGLRRVALDERCWVDWAPGWLAGSDVLFADLLATGPWRQREVRMYDRLLEEPRLVAALPVEELPPALAAARRSLSGRYGVDFDSCFVNLYRDGRDSVAWHGDRNRHTMTDPLVVTISLGERRRFRLRPRGGGTSRGFALGHGDLLVMGGATQHDWEHTVPKVASAGARMSVTMRHSS
jgi:alkylated DNA repair dioxygenase AlkB